MYTDDYFKELEKAIGMILDRVVEETDILGTKKIQVVDDHGKEIRFNMIIYNWQREMRNRKDLMRIDEKYPDSAAGGDILDKHEVVAKFLISTYIDKDGSLDDFLSEHSLDVVVNLTEEILNNLN